ncbi:MAG: hypothetical protein HYZ53_00720 [Planctomycetes bacterium]|nr:hypothetical protein [Planctomycetota bacterium]
MVERNKNEAAARPQPALALFVCWAVLLAALAATPFLLHDPSLLRRPLVVFSSGFVMGEDRGFGFVLLSLGKNRGLLPGDRFRVLRRGLSICELRVRKAADDWASADILRETMRQGERVTVGDSVSHELFR